MDSHPVISSISSSPETDPCLSLVTHLAIHDGVSNIIHEFWHGFGVLSASNILDATGYVSDLAFDLLRSIGKGSTEDKMKMGSEIIDTDCSNGES